MKSLPKYLTLLFLQTSYLVVYLNANETQGETLAKQFHLIAGHKAMKQWERVFDSSRKMKLYNIDTLTIKNKQKLKSYLIEHAIDSDHPTVAGEF